MGSKAKVFWAAWAVVVSLLILHPRPAIAAANGGVAIAVMGDSMADGLWGGLFRAWRGETSITVLRRGRTGTGLGHSAKFDWLDGTRQIVTEDRPDIAVVAIGLNDRVSLITERRSIPFGAAEWKAAYAARVDRMMDTLVAAKIPTVWIGLPVMRDEEARRDATMLNAIFAERAARHGITFLPMWVIAGSEDHFDPYGTDSSGRRRLLRAEDGVHYTSLGYDLLAGHLRAELVPLIKGVSEAKAAPAPAPVPASSPASSPAPSVAAADSPPPQAEAQPTTAHPPAAPIKPKVKPRPKPKPAPAPVAPPPVAPPPAVDLPTPPADAVDAATGETPQTDAAPPPVADPAPEPAPPVADPAPEPAPPVADPAPAPEPAPAPAAPAPAAP